MDVKMEDVCVTQEFRLTEYQVSNGGIIFNTYFNIRDENGVVIGCTYDDIKAPLDTMLRLCTT